MGTPVLLLFACELETAVDACRVRGVGGGVGHRAHDNHRLDVVVQPVFHQGGDVETVEPRLGDAQGLRRVVCIGSGLSGRHGPCGACDRLIAVSGLFVLACKAVGASLVGAEYLQVAGICYFVHVQHKARARHLAGI
ncbi:hypothetical protein D3C71_1265230 [compost metagenome]